MSDKPLFSLGNIVATPAALNALDEAGQAPQELLKRHHFGDWGDCSEEDKQENDQAVDNDLRIFSVYHTTNGQKIWIITEADRSSTCILLPDEY